jgi:acyl-CoA dehydrogenase
MEFGLTPEQHMLVESLRAFVEKELIPHEELVERTDRLPPELAAEIRRKAIEAGFYAANMPEELGGGGLDNVSVALLERELGRANYALHWTVARPSNILRACQGEQIERYLKPTIRGERVECLAMTEPGAGSDLRSMTTRAVRDGDHYVINGRKHFISHADVADYVILFAASGVEETKRGSKKKITSFLVDKDTPGFEVTEGYHSVSHRG